MIEFNLVLSSILDKSPSCCIPTIGLSLKAAVENWLLEPVRAFASNTE